MAEVFRYPEQLSEEHVGLVAFDELIDLPRGFGVVEVAALQRQSFEVGPEEPHEDLQLAQLDEIDGTAIGLQGLKGSLLIDLGVVVEGAQLKFYLLRIF